MKSARLALLLAAALGCAASRPPATASGQPVPDAALGLAKGSVFEVPAPPPWKPSDVEPGGAPAAPPSWPGAPPVVPHELAGFLPITPRSNSCVDCHAVAKKEPGQATPIPPSHRRPAQRARHGAGQGGGRPLGLHRLPRRAHRGEAPGGERLQALRAWHGPTAITSLE